MCCHVHVPNDGQLHGGKKNINEIAACATDSCVASRHWTQEYLATYYRFAFTFY